MIDLAKTDKYRWAELSVNEWEEAKNKYQLLVESGHDQRLDRWIKENVWSIVAAFPLNGQNELELALVVQGRPERKEQQWTDDILTPNRKGITKQQWREIIDFTISQKYRIQSQLVSGKDGLFYSPFRLSANQHIAQLNLSQYPGLDYLPDNLSVDAVVYPDFSTSLALTKIPDNFTVNNDFSIYNTLVEHIGNNLVVAKTLIMSDQTHESIMCQNLHIKNGNYTTVVDLAKIKIENDCQIRDCTLGGIANLTARSCTISWNIFYSKKRGLTKLTVEGDLSIYNNDAFEELGPKVRCKNLTISNDNLVRISPDIVILHDLKISNCPNLTNLENLVIGGDLRLEKMQKVQLHHTVVMGHTYIPESIQVPDSFCCLGQIVRTKE